MLLSRPTRTLLLTIFALTSVNIASAQPPQIKRADSLPQSTPWDLEALSAAPQFQWLTDTGPVRSLEYSALTYRDKPTQVFAYYASPATIQAPDAPEKPFPAVVLIHGGGGTAFSEWVQLSAQRGYAAISMDLAGCGPDRKRLSDGGPDQSHKEKFATITEPIANQWSFHAVANSILAHSLILSFDEVDPQRTAVTGISWGGYLTCIVAGLDNRFEAAVPVYGCGFLHENSCWLGEFAAMTDDDRAKWVRLWDPSMYIGSAAMPVFFVNGTNDFAYPLDSYAKTYARPRSGRNLRITVNMPHSHPHGWAPKEIGLFIDQYLLGVQALPVLSSPATNVDTVQCTIANSAPVTAAEIHYTTDSAPINKRTWQSLPAKIQDRKIVADPPPDDANIYFFTATDNRGAIVSSELVFTKTPAPAPSN